YPQVLGCGHAADVPLHRLQEQDRRENAVAVERRAGEHAGPHLLAGIQPLLLRAVPVLADAVLLEGLRRAPAALVQGGEEAAAISDLLQLRSVHGSHPGTRPADAGARPQSLPRVLALRMIWVTRYLLRPIFSAISSGRRPCSLYSSASRCCRWLHGLRLTFGAAGAADRCRGAAGRARGAAVGAGDGADEVTVVPNDPR